MKQSIAQKELNYIFRARQFVYDILARFFVEEPSKEYLKYFVESELISIIPFVEDSKGMEEAIGIIRAYLNEHDVINNNDDYENLHWDYTKMFIGPLELVAPPWESVYVRKDQLLFQENTVAVQRKFEEFGFVIRDQNLEAEDHIGFELDFMFHLNELCIDVIEKEEPNALSYFYYLIDQQGKFLENHLLAFVPAFSKRVMDGADTQFFKGMAKLLDAYLKLDKEILHEIATIDVVIRTHDKQGVL
ncbi:TorD/DmsD family molecular chaperone [Sporosarcina sp. FA9]|uniref:TorD/DmsD family molecular chaperone n=1 Tax=Sporosarcina sp. FA9 TaxID=3413030 RepID=UPI003F65A85B